MGGVEAWKQRWVRRGVGADRAPSDYGIEACAGTIADLVGNCGEIRRA